MDSPWAHLPSATRIDRVLADLRAHPLVWNTALDADRGAAWAAARSAARSAALDADRGAAWAAAWNTARDAAWDGTDWGAAWGTAWGACAALIAWPEDSALMLDMPVDAVRLLAASGHHPAVLMLPACIALSTQSNG